MLSVSASEVTTLRRNTNVYYYHYFINVLAHGSAAAVKRRLADILPAYSL